jgi:hypothetical protein
VKFTSANRIGRQMGVAPLVKLGKANFHATGKVPKTAGPGPTPPATIPLPIETYSLNSDFIENL